MSQLSNLQRKAIQVYREYEALIVILNRVAKDDRIGIERTKESIRTLSQGEIMEFTSKVGEETKELRVRYGTKAKKDIYLTILDNLSEHKDRYGMFPKYLIERELFSRYDRIMPTFKNLPHNALVGIDYGYMRSNRSEVEIFILEATLYEDMCALFNLAKIRSDELDRQTASKREIKETGCLERAAIAAAFYFVEAYLNGLAFDYYIEHEKELDANDKGFLLEWDFDKNRPRYLSFRDKALQYPKIILGTQHPPLQESNCPELSYFLDRAKLLRDSIVHAAPAVDTFDPVKEKAIYDTDFNEVEKLVDTAVALVKRIEETVKGSCIRLDWLLPRDAKGWFPDDVFK